MVCPADRQRVAEPLRRFLAGRMTVEEWEDRCEDLCFESADPALPEIWWAVWTLYDDIWTDELKGQWAVRGWARTLFARAVLFLYTDREYCWPKLRCPLVAAVRRVLRRLAGKEPERPIDLAIWPFESERDLEEARRHPPYLAGSRSV